MELSINFTVEAIIRALSVGNIKSLDQVHISAKVTLHFTCCIINGSNCFQSVAFALVISRGKLILTIRNAYVGTLFACTSFDLFAFMHRCANNTN